MLKTILLYKKSFFAQTNISECIAPSDPGGGWDFTCRSVSNLLYEKKLVNNPIRTINMAGAGGGVAFAHVISKRTNDDNLFVAASTATTTNIAQGQFRGMNEDLVKWIGALGADYGIIAVNKNSPYNTLSELLDALKQNRQAVKFAGASTSGGWDHLKVLLAAKAVGLDDLRKIRYLSFNNGGDAITQVVGGHLDAFTGDISESKGFIDSGDLKVLAVLSEERLPEPFANIPTAKEQGIDVDAPNWRGFYIPKNTSEETYTWWTETLNNLSKDPKWHTIMEQNGLARFDLTGADFEAYVKKQIHDINTISKEIGIIK